MTLSLFLFFLGLQGSQGSQAQLQQQVEQQTRQIEHLEREIQKLSSELQKTHTLLQNELKNGCDGQVQWLTANPRITNPLAPLRTNLFSLVSDGDCLPAEVRITATFFDSADTFLCSGSVKISQYARTQNLALEFNAYDIEVFTRWWDGPTLKQLGMICHDYQGVEMRVPADSAISMRLYATTSPKRGGLATAEIQVSLPKRQK